VLLHYAHHQQNFQQVGLAALSLGLIFVGTCNEDVGSVLVQRLMESTDTELDQSMAKFISLGLALLYLNKQEKADAMVEAVKTIEHSIGKFTEVVLEGCAYAATGNVLKVQKVLLVALRLYVLLCSACVVTLWQLQ
jgi:26S proteasome regulatory subunit N1